MPSCEDDLRKIPKPVSDIRPSAMKNFVAATGAIGVLRASPYLIVLILGSLFSKQVVSPLTIYITFVQLGAALIGLGFPQLFSIEVSLATKDSDIKAVFVAFMKIVTLSQIVLLPILFLTYWLLYDLSGQNFFLLCFALTASLPLALAGNITAVYIKKGKSLSLFFVNVLFFLILASALLVVGYMRELEPALSAATISAIYWLYFLICIKPILRLSSDVKNLSISALFLNRWRPAIYNLLASIVTPLGIVTVNSILLHTVGARAQAEFYMAYSIFSLLVFLPNALTQQVLMRISSLREDRNATRTALRGIILSHALIAVLVVGLGFIFVHAYQGGTGKVLVNEELNGFLFAAFTFYLISPMSQALIATGMERCLLAVNLLWLVSFILLAIVCIRLETIPIAYSYFASFLLVALGNYYFLRKKALI